MDDGSKQNRGLHLNVYAFDEVSVHYLILVLQKKYNLICSVHNHSKGKRIYIFEESMPCLRSIVLEHTVPSIYYKLGI